MLMATKYISMILFYFVNIFSVQIFYLSFHGSDSRIRLNLVYDLSFALPCHLIMMKTFETSHKWEAVINASNRFTGPISSSCL